eukprot:3554910-Ditylum_brightwellii.AAC.1
MVCYSLVVAIAILAMKVGCVAVTVIIVSGGKGIHFRVAFFVAAVDFKVHTTLDWYRAPQIFTGLDPPGQILTQKILEVAI